MNCICANCQTRDRWEATLYIPYLKDHPKEAGVIQLLRDKDKQILPCALKQIEQFKKEFDRKIRIINCDDDFLDRLDKSLEEDRKKPINEDEEWVGPTTAQEVV